MIEYVWIVVPSPDYPHWQAFTEIAASLSAALQELGHPAKIFKGPTSPNGKALVFGGHLLKTLAREDAIIFNSEQLSPYYPWVTEEYIALLTKHEVWDYSENNISVLENYRIKAKHCPIGYMPVLSDITPAPVENMDVVLVGSTCPRREKIMADLNAAGIGAYFISGYGKWRNSHIARAKIVLNVHYYDTAIFEIFRCAHLFANKKMVVSETGKDYNLEKPFFTGGAFFHYDQLVESCKTYLKDEDLRIRDANTGYDLIRQRPQTEILRGLI